MNKDFDCALEVLDLAEKAIKRIEKNEKLSFSEIELAIGKEYNNLYKSSCNFDELTSKLFSKKDNNCLFYTGIEPKIKEKYINQIDKYKSIVEEKYHPQLIVPKGLVKTKIPKRNDKNKKRLISILFFLTLQIQTNILVGESLFDFKYLYVMIPISYENCHSG